MLKSEGLEPAWLIAGIRQANCGLALATMVIEIIRNHTHFFHAYYPSSFSLILNCEEASSVFQ